LPGNTVAYLLARLDRDADQVAPSVFTRLLPTDPALL
jgi:hypothetical protein